MDRAARSPIGLDIGAHAIKAVQVRSGPDAAPRLHAVVTLPRQPGRLGVPLDAVEAADLAAALRRRGFAGRTLVTALPTLAQTVVPLQLPPPNSPAPRAAIALAQAADAARRDAADLQLCWWDSPTRGAGAGGTGAGSAAGLGIAAPTQTVLDLLAPLEAAGFDVEAIDAPAAALARACAPWLATDEALTAIVELGASALSIITIADHTVIYQRTLPELGLAGLLARLGEVVGDQALAAPLLARLAASRPDAGADSGVLRSARDLLAAWEHDAAREASVSLAYAATPDAPAPAVLLTGGGVDIPGVAAAIAGLMSDTNAQAVVLGDGADLSGLRDEARAEAAGASAPLLALGLALHGAGAWAAARREAAAVGGGA